MRKSVSEPLENFSIDAFGTLNVLEAYRLNDVKHIVFAYFFLPNPISSTEM